MDPTNDDGVAVKREDVADGQLAEQTTVSGSGGRKVEPSLDGHKSPTPPHNGFEDSRSPSIHASQALSGDDSTIEVKYDSNAHDATRGSPTKPTLKPTKAGRGGVNKPPPRSAPLFDHLPDATDEANSSYTVMESCTYQNKFLGFTEHAMECDCAEEWDASTKINYACGEDSDCINRLTKMECVGDCGCGAACQNQRFGRHLFADVSVIKTDKKGYGLRTNVDLKHGDFIFEYIGEVIGENAFRRRMVQYDEEGIKHFYFMSLSKGEFVDATRKGNLGRFCNHSCNPNCYVDKWVVGDKLRMGIFAEKKIKAGEELVFNYNVDRYGANPQPCYCGESNCTGFIGGKTQTERATKLATATLEALGIDDDFDSWDTAVAKKPRKKKAGEDDEDYVDSIQAKNLDADGVTKVMAALMQCKEKWIAVRLLQRIERSEDEDVRHRIVKLHGYKIMNSQLSAWKDDENVILQILEILDQMPRLTRNKIVDAKIERTLEPLATHADERVATKASSLLESWSKLELAYRIPRKVRDANAPTSAIRIDRVGFERRETASARKPSRSRSRSRSKSRSRSRSRSPPRGPSGAVPSGPRAHQHLAGRPSGRPFPRGPSILPRGWSQAVDEKSGRTYFYAATGKTQWVRPTQPADAVPPPPKQPSQQEVLKSIIDGIVTATDKEKDSKSGTPDTPEPTKRDRKAEKWRTYDEDKQKKLYENTLFPHISHVMNKYKHKIPRDDLKRFGKELAKKLVNSDYKAGRVKNPTTIDEKQQKKVKAYCKEYFDKAAVKHKKHQEEKALRKAHKQSTAGSVATPVGSTPAGSPKPVDDPPVAAEADDDEDIKMSDNELEPDETPDSPSHGSNDTLKRKRLVVDSEDIKDEEDDLLRSPAKKLNLDSAETSPMPPPPPPPAPPADTPPEIGTPTDAMDTDIHADTNFKGRSMADVQALAQQDEDEDENKFARRAEADVKSEELKVEVEPYSHVSTNGVQAESLTVDKLEDDVKVKTEQD